MSEPAANPAELISRAQRGDQPAFGQLMRENYSVVYRVVYSVVRNEHDARDICQEVWLKVWNELPKFRGDSKFTTWVHPIAVRKSLDHLRKRRRWFDRFLPFAGAVDDDSPHAAAPEPSTDTTARDDAEGRERAEHLHRALDALPPKQRAILVLRELEGQSYEEIAAALSVPLGTVMSRLYHARRLLAQKLKETP